MSSSQQAAPLISEDRDHDMTVVDGGINGLSAQLLTPNNFGPGPQAGTEAATIGNQQLGVRINAGPRVGCFTQA